LSAARQIHIILHKVRFICASHFLCALPIFCLFCSSRWF